MSNENFDPKNQSVPEQETKVLPDHEEVIPVRVPPDMAKEKTKKEKKVKPPKYKGNKAITWTFYICYFLLIISFCVGMYFVHGWLVDWLVDFENAQPTVKSEAVFQDLFDDPDWGRIYEETGLTDTEFEGKDAFTAYMENIVGENSLTYAETSAGLSGDHKYLVQLEGKTLGYFTLSNHAEADAPIPDWQLNEVNIHLTRSQSVAIEKQDGHTAYVNGQAVGDSYTVEMCSTVAESYLPEGTAGIRRIRQEVTGLLVVPQVTILDDDGNECAVFYDEESGMYIEEAAEAEPITDELEARAIAAGEAFSYYMVNRNTHLFGQYFASGTTTYRNITSMDRWQQTSTGAAITGQAVSDYIRYTDDLFSVRVTMTMELTRVDDSIKEYPLDATLFFENRKAGWMVISMTYVDVTEATSQVRLTFMSGDTPLSTAFYDSNATEIFAPALSVPEGQVFSGWAEKEVSADGTTTMNLAFTCDENNRLIIPNGTELRPMTLYALFEDAEETVS